VVACRSSLKLAIIVLLAYASPTACRGSYQLAKFTEKRSEAIAECALLHAANTPPTSFHDHALQLQRREGFQILKSQFIGETLPSETEEGAESLLHSLSVNEEQDTAAHAGRYPAPPRLRIPCRSEEMCRGMRFPRMKLRGGGGQVQQMEQGEVNSVGTEEKANQDPDKRASNMDQSDGLDKRRWLEIEAMAAEMRKRIPTDEQVEQNDGSPVGIERDGKERKLVWCGW
jgi:hypothetical protein